MTAQTPPSPTATCARRILHGILPGILLALLAACGDEGSTPTSVGAGLGIPSARFVGAEAVPDSRDGERRVAVTLRPSQPVRIALDGGELLPGDVLAIDFRAAAAGAGGASAQARITLKPSGAAAAQDFASQKGRWTTARCKVPTGCREITASAVAGGDVLVAAPRIQRSGWEASTVVLITSDTHRADHVSTIDPSSPIRTRHIDALAARGAVFTDCYSSTNVTNPSHIALMTGIHPRDTKIIGNNKPLHDSASTLAERFHAAGYQTFAAMSAFHLDDELSGLGQGFDRMDTTGGFARDGRETLDIVGRWMEDAEGAPLFLWLHLFDAHAPYRVPDEIEARLLEGRPDPRRASAALPIPADVVPGWITAAELTDPDYVSLLYAGEVEYLDGLLGGFLESKRMRSAIIAFTSDHGEGLGEDDVWWDHSGVHAPMLHVPLILYGDGVDAGLRCAERVEQIDVGRTLLDMSGLETVEFPGQDLRVALREPPPEEPRFALSANGASASIEVEGWLLEMYLRDDRTPSSGRERAMGECSLFDLERDPNCTSDRLLDHFDRGRTLRTALIDWLDAAEATGLHPYNYQASEEQLAKLRELGYSGGMESVLRWWGPEKRDEAWASKPWCLAFEGDGNVSVLEELEGAR